MSDLKTLKDVYERLEEYRTTINPKPKAEDEWDDNRHTYCHLMFLGKVDGNRGPHRFQVRSWEMKKDMLIIHCVNWTCCAGTCSLELKDNPDSNDRITNWAIIEDHPKTLGILFEDK